MASRRVPCVVGLTPRGDRSNSRTPSLLLWTWLRPDPLLLARAQLLARSRPSPEAPEADGAAAPARAAAPGSRDSLADTLRATRQHLRRTPRAAFAFLAIVLGHTIMGAVMTMASVSMTRNGAALSVVGVTVSIHLLGMYAFSPAVGRLADRCGNLPVVLAGQAVFVVSALASVTGRGSTGLMMLGMFTLGLGWSFSLVAGSAMLNEAAPAALRPGVQGTADTAMNIVAAAGAGAAGPVMDAFGYGGLNAFAGALVLPVVVFGLFLGRAARRRHAPPPAS